MMTQLKKSMKLLHMEQYWAKSRSGPFPKSIQNGIADLRAAMEKQKAETAPLAETLVWSVNVSGNEETREESVEMEVPEEQLQAPESTEREM